MPEAEEIYRAGFVALRDLTVHTQTCMRCLRQGLLGTNSTCPVWKAAVENIRKANELWIEEQCQKIDKPS